MSAAVVARPHHSDHEHDDADDETWALELEEELLAGSSNETVMYATGSSTGDAKPTHLSQNDHSPMDRSSHKNKSDTPRCLLAMALPQEVLVNIVEFTPVGRVSKAWSLASSTLARRKFLARLTETLQAFTADAPVLAQEIEASLFAAYGQSFSLPKSYAQKARQLLFNLKDSRNAALRERLFTGDLPVAALVRMSASDMANPQLVQQREQWIKKRTHEVMRDTQATDGFTQTDLFECRACGSFRTGYRQWRRKAIVDRTRVIVSCRDCPYRWEL